MEYTLIKGNFHVVGYSPDGDSLMFRAKNKARWDKIATDHREILEQRLAERDGALQLRLQGIDALETHYSPGTLPTPGDLKHKESGGLEKPDPGDHKQPVELARRAAGELMRILGIERVEWRTFGKSTWINKAYVERRGKEVVIEEKHGEEIPGYIVTRDVDLKGRPIAWVFAGSTRDRDGARLSQDRLLRRLEASANYQLLKRGLVYPYFFMTLPSVLRGKLSEAAQQALAEARGQAPHKPDNIWLYDKSTQGVKITSLSNITEGYEIYPYLFRKVIKHWYRTNMERYWQALRDDASSHLRASSTRVTLKGFFDGGNPYVFTVSDRDFVKLDEVVEIKGNTLTMKRYPYDIVFLS